MTLSPTDNSSDFQQGAVSVPRVAIVGTGFVGSTTAYALLMSVIFCPTCRHAP